MFYRPELDEIPEHLKSEGNGWYAIFNVAVPRTLDVQLLHGIETDTFPTCVQFSPDDSLLAAGFGERVRVWRGADYRTICNLDHDSEQDPGVRETCYNRVRSLCFFPDGRNLAVGHEAGAICLWDIKEEDEMAIFYHERAVTALTVSPDAKTVLSVVEGGTVSQWDVSSKQQIHSISLDAEYLGGLALASDGSRLAVGVKSSAQIYQLPGFHYMQRLGSEHGHRDVVTSVAYSPGQDKLASASLDQTCKVWRMDNENTLQHTLEGHGNFVLHVRWTPCGQWLLSGSKDGTVQLWDPHTGNAQLSLKAHGNSVLDVSFARDGHRFVTAGGDERLRIWSFHPHASTKLDDATARPGCGLPLGFVNPLVKHFPSLNSSKYSDWCIKALLIREVCMMKMVEDVTNEPKWWLDASSPDACARWKQEALDRNWAGYRKYGDFTPAMTDACINEICLKAEVFQKTGLVPIFDAYACAVKSVVASDLISRLQSAASSLEDAPEEQVQHLVHPSLWPFIYGRTRILTKDTINVHNCLASIGRGELLASPDAAQAELKPRWPEEDCQPSPLSVLYQWLPSEVKIDSNGHSSIDSYINNLHPTHHAQLYSVINSFIEKSLPAWDLIYRWPSRELGSCYKETFDGLGFRRIETLYGGPVCTVSSICDKLGCCPESRPLAPGESKRKRDEMCDDGYKSSNRARLDKEWYEATHPLFVPDAVEPVNEDKPKSRFTPFSLRPDEINTSAFFNHASRIQVIVKLVTINLTPESPAYHGGKWHVEGQLGDHICATALFLYDDENVGDSGVAFRVSCTQEYVADQMDGQWGDHWSMTRIFALDSDDWMKNKLQDLGSTLLRQGRAIFFPNIFLQRILPFSLTDISRPGHRKMLALFLVDPAIPIISTANVPPQQPGWREEHEGADDGVSQAEAKRIFEEFLDKRYVL
ncbi:hypothetical protein XA68_15594 [Ophiocordyceps unilateralis]|uniref:Uncharacterized protein n=1 Tax=Ophiocordyceps unilateralis TaxID=268505 RepID=A0A2A9P697_OPHUN|nr:hypothetical protein XA68_15594 [Ophiocordyceps unilateralis]